MEYKEAMKYIKQVGNFGSNYGLERTERLLEILGNPHKKLRLIHIAGTNGKGSTTATLSTLLMGKGYKVGMYTSPFLEEFEERIQINGVNIEKHKLGALMDEVKEAVDKLIEEGLNHPTEFEIITCLMFLHFFKEKVDYGVIEVGLGGRLDSTNVITPILSVIMSISYDHTNLLGNTLKEIATEKAGIIKEGIPVVIYPQEEEALLAIKEKANILNSKIYETSDYKAKFIKVINKDKIYQRLNIEIDGERFIVDYPLLGEHQISNLLVALKAYKLICKMDNISFEKEDIIASLKMVKWIGRLEVMNKEPLVVIDGAHNIQGIKALRRNTEKYFKYKNVYLILGILADKQVHEMVEEIVPIAKKVIALTPLSDRAEIADHLKSCIEGYNDNVVSLDNNYKEAIEMALKETNKDDLILVSGSLYMIGEMRRIIRWQLGNAQGTMHN